MNGSNPLTVSSQPSQSYDPQAAIIASWYGNAYDLPFTVLSGVDQFAAGIASVVSGGSPIRPERLSTARLRPKISKGLSIKRARCSDSGSISDCRSSTPVTRRGS